MIITDIVGHLCVIRQDITGDHDLTSLPRLLSGQYTQCRVYYFPLDVFVTMIYCMCKFTVIYDMLWPLNVLLLLVGAVDWRKEMILLCV